MSEEPAATSARRRGCRAGRREQQRRQASTSRGASSATTREVTVPRATAPSGTAPNDGSGDHVAPSAVTITLERQAVLTAAVHEAVHQPMARRQARSNVVVVGAHRVVPNTPTSAVGVRNQGSASTSTDTTAGAQQAAATQQPMMPPLPVQPMYMSLEYELIGAVYETGRMNIIGQMTVYGLPVDGHFTMGSLNMHPEATNATFLSSGNPIESVPTNVVQQAHAFVALLDVHWRITRGTIWFDRGSAQWDYEMELSWQQGAVVTPGQSRIQVRFERPL